jgi:hypothetical protein
MTRKRQVLGLLEQFPNQWIDGTRLATEEVGGSEGLKRLRELRAEGSQIQRRKHPNPTKQIFQYRLTTHPTITPSSPSRVEYIPQDVEEMLKAWQVEE